MQAPRLRSCSFCSSRRHPRGYAVLTQFPALPRSCFTSTRYIPLALLCGASTIPAYSILFRAVFGPRSLACCSISGSFFGFRSFPWNCTAHSLPAPTHLLTLCLSVSFFAFRSKHFRALVRRSQAPLIHIVLRALFIDQG